jgi:hypothetical protein
MRKKKEGGSEVLAAMCALAVLLAASGALAAGEYPAACSPASAEWVDQGDVPEDASDFAFVILLASILGTALPLGARLAIYLLKRRGGEDSEPPGPEPGEGGSPAQAL